MKNAMMTLSELAAVARIEPHRARYIVDLRGIKPVTRIRHYRVFDEIALELVRQEARRMKQRPGAASSSGGTP